MSRRPRIYLQNRRKGGVLRWIPRLLFLACVAITVAGACGAVGAYVYFARGLPPVPALDDYAPPTVSQIYAHDGRLLGELTVERRVVVPLEKMPRHLIEAFLASEDQRFFEHTGVDFRGVIRAALANYRAGHVVEGASTITQQLCKTLVGNERSFTRKAREAILARRTESRLSKLEILYLYLNQIYLGHGAYGVQAAAQSYFRKDAWQLDLAESAMIAGLPPKPSKVTPVLDLPAAKARQRHVLDRMVEEGFVGAEEADAAYARKLVVYAELPDVFRETAPYFSEHVRKHVQKRYGYDAVNREGLRVYTTVDADYQRFAQDALKEGLNRIGARQGWPGPLKHLRPEEIEAFVAAAKALYGGPGELAPETYYLGLASEVEKRGARVRVGDVEGWLPLKGGLAWAAPYDEAGSRNNRRIADAREALAAGDVVIVRRNRGAKLRAGAETPVLWLSLVPRVQGALISLDPHTGYVVAMVGGYDFDQSEYNRAFQGCRQPGSVFKPIVYSRALDMEYTLATPLADTPITVFDSAHHFIWKPKNYAGNYRGEVILRNALIHSMNIPSINVINYVGPPNAAAWAKHLGLTTPMSPDPSLVLGSSCVYPWDMVRVYAVFALRGERPRTAFITRVEDRHGGILEDRTVFDDPWAPTGPKLDGMLRAAFEPRPRAMGADTAYLVQRLLKEVIDAGTGFKAKALGKPAGGKTGTTDAYDAWFLGFTESLVTGVWIGSDLNKRKLGSGETGGKVALPVWLAFMREALDGMPQKDFTKAPPPGIVFASVDYRTGLLAVKGNRALSLPFKVGTEPTEQASRMGSFDQRDLDSVEGRF